MNKNDTPSINLRGLYRKSLNLVRFCLNYRGYTPEQRKKLTELLARDCQKKEYVLEVPAKNNKKTFETIRDGHTPMKTADFLSLFERRDGLKYLTHDFEPNSGMTMMSMVENTNRIIDSKGYTIPKSVYSLIKGYISGASWLDCFGVKHYSFLQKDDWRKYEQKDRFIHPITTDAYGDEVQRFGETIRVRKPHLQDLLDAIPEAKNVKIEKMDLDKFDVYTNVYVLTSILRDILKDFIQRNRDSLIQIRCERGIFSEYRTYSIKLVHSKSTANSIEEVQSKLKKGGGALFRVLGLCESFCDWSIEGNFEGRFLKWRILDSTGRREIEEIQKTADFVHTFTYYKKV